MNIVGSNNVFSNYIKTLVNDKYNIRSGYAYYDSITHYYLGRYLRDYKKETGIDLTSMYNCYSENMISKYRLKTNSFTSYAYEPINNLADDVRQISSTSRGVSVIVKGDQVTIKGKADSNGGIRVPIPALYLEEDCVYRVSYFNVHYNPDTYAPKPYFWSQQLNVTQEIGLFVNKDCSGTFTLSFDTSTYYMDIWLAEGREYDVTFKVVVSKGDKEHTHYIENTNPYIAYEATLENVDTSAYDLVYMPVLPKDILSLYFDTALPITLAVASYNGIDFVDKRFDNVQVIPSSRIKEPFIYKVPDYDTDQKDNAYRVDNLVLLIQVPKSCSKRIALLGDYSNTSTKVVSYDASSENTQIIPNINSFLKEGRCQSFLDELIPYLTNYAITELDEVFQNISSIQSFMSSYKLRKTYGMRYVGDIKEGTLDSAQREWLKQFKSKYIGNYNNIGRVDKDVEELLDRGGNLDA